jgi:capsular polysaccharide biosynthesis protein
MLETPSLANPIKDNIDCLKGALVIPPPKGDANRSVQKSGVLDAEGNFVANSITWRNTNQVNLEPPMPPEAEIVDLEGSYMFAGLLFGHFGHFLVESICRIWAVEFLKDKIDGVIFVPKFQNRPQHVMNVYRPFLELLGVDMPVINIEDPTRVETLYVPQQGFGMFEMIEGAPEFRNFINKHAGKNVTPVGPEKIYVSRSALPPQRGSLLGEKRLEALLEEEGYTAFHPQKHSHEEQIAAYKAARCIISIDGSPLHLAALVGDGEQKIACIARRAGDLDKIFARQFKAFQGNEVTTISALVQNWIPETDNRPSRVSFGEVDFSEIYTALKSGGFIEGDTPWKAFTDEDRAEMMAELEAHQKVAFKAYVKP